MIRRTRRALVKGMLDAGEELVNSAYTLEGAAGELSDDSLKDVMLVPREVYEKFRKAFRYYDSKEHNWMGQLDSIYLCDPATGSSTPEAKPAVWWNWEDEKE